MNQIYFAQINNLQIGDRLIREKGIVSKHHGIYVGVHDGIPLVAENQVNNGVRYVQLINFLNGNFNNVTRIERYSGSEYARDQIIPRINKLLGTKYDLINFNCEHFAELIQNGVSKSNQVKTGLGIALLGLFAIAIFSK